MCKRLGVFLAALLACSRALAGEGLAPPAQEDPLGFVGSWVEFWPNEALHDVSTVTCANGQYAVQVVNPNSGPYRILDVRVEGNALKFAEQPRDLSIQYEVTRQDGNTLLARVRDVRGNQATILWRRQTPESLRSAPPCMGTGELVVALSWQREGSDIELVVTGPDGRRLEGQANTPGQSTCTIPTPANGPYGVDAANLGGGPTQVAAEVRFGRQTVGKCVATLAQRGERTHVFTANITSIGQAPPDAPAHTRMDVEFKRATVEQISELLRSMGHPFRQDKLPTGEPAWFLQLGSWNVGMWARDDLAKGDGAYNSLSLTASIPPAPLSRAELLERVNTWNLTMHSARACLDTRGGCLLSSDCDLIGGVSLEVVREFITGFRRSLNLFANRMR